MDRRVARRYARALGELAHQQQMLARVEEDLSVVKQAMEGDGTFRRVWEHQRLERGQKQQFVEQIFGETLSPLTLNFLFLLLRKRRESIFDAVVEEFALLANEVRDIVDVEVKTARQLRDDEREALSKRMSEYLGKKVRLVEVTAPELLGGVVARVGDLVMDGSVLTRLRKLQGQLRVNTWHDDEG